MKIKVIQSGNKNTRPSDVICPWCVDVPESTRK